MVVWLAQWEKRCGVVGFFLMVVMWSRLGKKIKVSGERRTRARTKVLQFG